MDPLIYVINLDRAQARLAALKAQIDRLGWSFRRVTAIDGRQMDPASLARLAPAPWSRYQSRRLTPGEIGCLASHRMAWTALIDSGRPWALVLEDDAVLGSEVPQALDVFARQTAFDLVKLEGISVKVNKSFGTRMVEGPPDIFLMQTVSAGAAVYCLTQRGAQKLLRITASMNREVDFFIRQFGLTDLIVGEFRPFPAYQDRSDSFIGAARITGPRGRGWYRLVRAVVRTRASLTRRWRWRRLAGNRRRTAVSLEGSSRDGFDREV